MSETKTGSAAPGAAWPETNGVPPWMEGLEDLIPKIDYDALVTEDGRPVDNLYVEKLYRLLTDRLYTSWRPGRPFMAMSDVGWFHHHEEQPMAPDVMVSLDVTPRDPTTREGRSYFQWVHRKPPDVVIEVLSDERGDEAGEKMRKYQQWDLRYYVIHDPLGVISEEVLRAFELRGGRFAPIDPRWIENLGLGLTMWEGNYQGVTHTWLRWCDRDGKVLPTGEERAALAEETAERLRAQLRKLGAEPEA
jgi:Uma2 family endonuclease